MIKILLLEDDLLFAQTLIDFLEEYEYNIMLAQNGEEFLDIAYENTFDIYLLDINVPKINGLDVLKNIRSENNNTPCIFLTSYKDSDTLKEAFTRGADDFLKKPFDMDELNLRILSLLKRSGKVLDIITIDEVQYNPSLKSISANGEEVQLGSKVIELFELFYENNHKIVTKQMIIDRLWSYDEAFSEGSIRVYVAKIQKLFETKKITNIKNIGYKIEF